MIHLSLSRDALPLLIKCVVNRAEYEIDGIAKELMRKVIREHLCIMHVNILVSSLGPNARQFTLNTFALIFPFIVVPVVYLAHIDQHHNVLWSVTE